MSASYNSRRARIFFGVEAQHAAEIESWLESEGLTYKIFYASFVNFCLRTVRRSQEPGILSFTQDEQLCCTILSGQWPTNAVSFMEMMDWYAKTRYNRGEISGGEIKIGDCTQFDIEQAQDTLYQLVFSSGQREAHREAREQAAGRSLPRELTASQQRAARRAAKAADLAKQREEEQRLVGLGQPRPMDAMTSLGLALPTVTRGAASATPSSGGQQQAGVSFSDLTFRDASKKQ